MKRIVTIQDISCLGKCSLTVALPIISAMGIEASIIPSAVLSTHTLFNNYTFRDLTDEITPISAHWKSENFKFDAIYTGYLGSVEQLDVVKQFFDDFKTDENFIYVDPAMADNGTLYPAFDDNFPKLMAEVCARADIISPNLTEACLMTDTEYKQEYDNEYIKSLLRRLTDTGAQRAIITGAHIDGEYGVVGYDRKENEYFSYKHEKLNQIFYGTGDVFSSACVGALTRGKSLMEAIKIASDFTFESIRLTVADPDARLYGVNFEEALPSLINNL